MIFSADLYETDFDREWKLPGAEVILSETTWRGICSFKERTGTFLTLHSPMSVSIGSTKGGVRFRSTDIVCEHLTELKKIQPNETSRIVVHAANYSDRSVEEVWEVQRKTLWSLWFKMKERGLLDNSLICIENLGKVSQVGTIEEICRLCNLTDNFIPCIDFGHLHGRTLGSFLNNKEDFEQVFRQLYSSLPAWKVNTMHIHFSKLEYTDKGEKKHVPFSKKEAGPKPGYFLRALPRDSSFSPVIVCESPSPHRDGWALKRNFDARVKSML